jgi:ferredoxin
VSAKKAEDPIIEPAKSGRASCRNCRRKILKGEYRIGIPYQFTIPDGETVTSYGYYHPECSPQDKIKTILKALGSSTSIDSANRVKIEKSLNKSLEESVESPPSRSESQQLPFLESSKSSRGICRICEKKIEKGILRVAEPTRVELDDGRKFFSHKLFHVKCYLESVSEVKSIFHDLIQTSLKRKSILQEEADNFENDFQELLSADETAAVVLSFISEQPIELEYLNKIAKEKGVPFSTVKKALEKGLLNGVFFEPTPGKIQKL